MKSNSKLDGIFFLFLHIYFHERFLRCSIAPCVCVCEQMMNIFGEIAKKHKCIFDYILVAIHRINVLSVSMTSMHRWQQSFRWSKSKGKKLQERVKKYWHNRNHLSCQSNTMMILMACSYIRERFIMLTHANDGHMMMITRKCNKMWWRHRKCQCQSRSSPCQIVQPKNHQSGITWTIPGRIERWSWNIQKNGQWGWR